MSRLDVLKSLLRSGVQSAGRTLRELPLSAELARALGDARFGRVAISDAELSAAVARGRAVTAASVSCAAGLIAVDASYEDGSDLCVSFEVASTLFAPGGAKELRFLVRPAEAAGDSRVREVFAAIAGAIARRLWAPVLGRTPDPGHSAFVDRDGALLSIDLRTVPAVRAALARPVTQAALELLKPKALAPRAGGLDLVLGLEGLLPGAPR